MLALCGLSAVHVALALLAVWFADQKRLVRHWALARSHYEAVGNVVTAGRWITGA